MTNFLNQPRYSLYGKNELQPHLCMNRQFLNEIETTDGIHIERLLKDESQIRDRIKTIPIFATHHFDEDGKIIKNSYDYFTGFHALKLIQRVPLENRPQLEILIYCFKSMPDEICLEFAKSSLACGPLSGKITWKEYLDLLSESPNPQPPLYDDSIGDYAA